MRHSIPAQREMATLLSEYGVDRLAERTFSTVSVLRRVLDRYRRVCHQLDASPSQSRQDALKAQDQLHEAKLSYKFDRAHWESERQRSADAATYTAERYQDDVKELVHEHNANKRGLQEEISKLRQELEDAHAYQRVLDRRAREFRFDVTDLMNFLGDNSTLACNWVRLRDLLQHYQDRTPIPQSWQTVIATTAGDDPLSQPKAFTRLDHPDDQDGESKQEDNPDSPPDPPSKRCSSRRRSSGSSSTPSGPKRTSKRSSHKAPAAPQLRPLERVEDSSSCLPEGTPPVWPVERARGPLPGPIVWDDLRLDVQRLICSGIFLNGAVSWLQEDRPVHTRFCQDDLVEMLSRMMFWNKLNESHWPKYAPERYYLAAEARLDDMEEQKYSHSFGVGSQPQGTWRKNSYRKISNPSKMTNPRTPIGTLPTRGCLWKTSAKWNLCPSL
ncbi:hypothetical protein PR001_g15264 [Phytophthora rubi]|uniref:Uncharacterized protein n=1 Tax=Phytophthora rubi TaxID=129364 RepID=A0A6A3L4X5_9STRA|nr:hypothetical protein PR001_g15264 [Phytophthora rubi]